MFGNFDVNLYELTIASEFLLKNLSWMISRERTGKTNERTTVVDTNSLTSRGLLTLKKTIPGTKKSFWPSSGQKWTF